MQFSVSRDDIKCLWLFSDYLPDIVGNHEIRQRLQLLLFALVRMYFALTDGAGISVVVKQPQSCLLTDRAMCFFRLASGLNGPAQYKTCRTVHV